MTWRRHSLRTIDSPLIRLVMHAFPDRNVTGTTSHSPHRFSDRINDFLTRKGVIPDCSLRELNRSQTRIMLDVTPVSASLRPSSLICDLLPTT